MSAPAAKRTRILVIDDDPIVRESLKLALTHAGFDAWTLEGPQLTLSVVKARRPDAIILDLYMPEGSGLDLCRELTKDPETKTIPIVVFSGSSETVDVMAGIQAGAIEYIAKPVDTNVMIAKLRSILKLPPK
jgi:DNA-binding response OmpR family regulator